MTQKLVGLPNLTCDQQSTVSAEKVQEALARYKFMTSDEKAEAHFTRLFDGHSAFEKGSARIETSGPSHFVI